MNLFERILDRIYWTFVLLVMIVLALVICAVDFFLESFFHEEYNRFFSAPADQAIEAYRAFQSEHRFLCWFLQWPLMMVGM
jgi:hypothetical protein